MGEPLGQPKLIIVEGKDEVNYGAALRHSLAANDVEIRSFDGGDNLRGYLKALRSIEGFDAVLSLGIIRDAEGNAAAKLQSTRDALRDAGFPVPPATLVVANGTPNVAILLNPHGQPNGSLDDVCLQAVSGHAAMPCVDDYFACLARQNIAVAANVAKAKAHAFIASRPRPNISLGVAVREGYFPLADAAFDPVRTLFGLL